MQQIKGKLDTCFGKIESLSKEEIETRLINFLFTYRNTPSTVTEQTPSEIIFKQKPRTRFDLLKPCLNNDENNVVNHDLPPNVKHNLL